MSFDTQSVAHFRGKPKNYLSDLWSGRNHNTFEQTKTKTTERKSFYMKFSLSLLRYGGIEADCQTSFLST